MITHTEPKPSTINTDRDEWIEKEATRVVAELLGDLPQREESTNQHPAPDSQAAVVPVEVSIYQKTPSGPGSFAVQLCLDEIVVTTTVSMGECSELGLHLAARQAAIGLTCGQLQLARAVLYRTADASDEETFDPDAEKLPEDGQPYRQTFVVSSLCTNGAPEFSGHSLTMVDFLDTSAAFAEFASQIEH